LSASTYLGNLGISVQDARTFIFSNLDNPALIFNTAAQYGVTNEMLGEIVGGYNADQVGAFFDSHGLASAQLDSAHPLLADDMAQLSGLFSLDNEGGMLSVAYLRQQVVAQTGLPDYQAAFDPNLYDGAADGVFTPAELGVSGLGTLPASIETIESLFFGTLITAFRSVDVDEAMDLLYFLEANGDALDSGNLAVEAQFLGLLVDVFVDLAAPAVFSDSDIVEFAVAAGVTLVQLVGIDPGWALFSLGDDVFG
jgi:hypothetical protein